MSEYRIEKLRRPLTVVLTDGSRLEGDVFLRPMTRFRSRPEEPSDLLNDAEPFFALVRDGKVVLVSKSNVALAETLVGEEEEFDLGSLGIPVEVTLNDGSVHAGSIFLETRSDRPRLLDFLNSYSSRFLPVVDARQVFLVNTQIIAHVREVA
ncbi:MAG TPA: hypothetical protein VIF32_03670 [Gemmatimonadaceae bacterium]|jgi:hypothetical protein